MQVSTTEVESGFIPDLFRIYLPSRRFQEGRRKNEVEYIRRPVRSQDLTGGRIYVPQNW